MMQVLHVVRLKSRCQKHYKWNDSSAYSGYKWTKTITIFFSKYRQNFSLRDSTKNAHESCFVARAVNS